MDINKLIDFYDKEQKILFTSFCITLPLAYTILYLYIPSFKILELFVRIVFSISASICSVTITFFSLLVSIAISNIERNIRLFHVIIPQIVTTSTCVCFPNIFGFGIWEPVILFLLLSHGIVVSYYIIFRILNFTEIKEEYKTDFKKKRQNNR